MHLWLHSLGQILPISSDAAQVLASIMQAHRLGKSALSIVIVCRGGNPPAFEDALRLHPLAYLVAFQHLYDILIKADSFDRSSSCDSVSGTATPCPLLQAQPSVATQLAILEVAEIDDPLNEMHYHTFDMVSTVTCKLWRSGGDGWLYSTWLHAWDQTKGRSHAALALTPPSFESRIRWHVSNSIV